MSIYNHEIHLTKHDHISAISLPHPPLSRVLLLLIKQLDESVIPVHSLLPHLPLSLLSLLPQSHHLASLSLLNRAKQMLISLMLAEWTWTRAVIIRWDRRRAMRISKVSLRKMVNSSDSITQSIISNICNKICNRFLVAKYKKN